MRFDEHSIRLFLECHHVTFAEMKAFQHLLWDRHLQVLPYASDSYFGCGCSLCHGFRLAERQQMSRPFSPCQAHFE